MKQYIFIIAAILAIWIVQAEMIMIESPLQNSQCNVSILYPDGSDFIYSARMSQYNQTYYNLSLQYPTSTPGRYNITVRCSNGTNNHEIKTFYRTGEEESNFPWVKLIAFILIVIGIIVVVVNYIIKRREEW